MTTKNLSALVKKVTPLEEKALAFSVTDDASLNVAVVMLSETNQFADRVQEEKEKVTKPLNEALKAERARWKPVEEACARTIATLKAKMVAYRAEVEAKNREAQAKIIARVEKGTLRAETAVTKLETLPDENAMVATTAGAIQWRTSHRLSITDENAIPREFLVIDEVKLRAALKAGTKVPGAELVEEKIPVNFR